MKINKVLNEDTFGNAIERTADQIDAVPASYSGEGDIERALNMALKTAVRNKKMGGNIFNNILLVGRAGVGKTSRVRAWCEKRGLHMYALDCKTLDTTDLGGALFPMIDKENPENDRAKKLQTDMLDQLDKPNSVLFLDEYNRARPDVRGTLLTLVNDHVIVTSAADGGERKFPNFLFTIAAINPPNMAYGDVGELDAAERSRFFQVDVEADKKSTLGYLTHKYNNQLDQLKKNGPIVDEDTGIEITAEEILGRMKMAEKLLKDPRLEFADDEAEALAAETHSPILNPRSLEMALEASDGTKEGLLWVWNSQCGRETKGMAEAILEDYEDVDDKANSVFKDANPFGDAPGFKKKEANAFTDISKALGF